MGYSCKSSRGLKQSSEIILFFKAISDQNRLNIICFLKNGEQGVCKIAQFLELPQNLVSHHLKVLKKQNIVTSRKEGLRIFYTLNKKYIKREIKYFNQLINNH